MAKARKIEGLDCHAGAMTGMRLVLFTRLEEMCEFRAAALDSNGIDAVHDMRVASRRLRSLLKDFQPYLRAKISGRGLRDIARSLGSVRDEDVAIAALEKLYAEAPENVQAGLRQIIEGRGRRRAESLRALEGELGEAPISRLKEKLSLRFEQATADATEEPTDGASGQPQAESISFQQAGREIILKLLEELNKLARSLFRPFEVERLHRMRIAAKRLRYALELFAQCLGDRLKEFAHEIAAMQSSLGELHDSDVWIEYVGEYLSHAHRREENSALRDAALWLLNHFALKRSKHYSDALERWIEWERSGFNARLTEALYSTEAAALEPSDETPVAAETVDESLPTAESPASGDLC